MSDLFKEGSEGGEFGASEENLMKALYAGDGSGYQSEGGRALIPENIDPSVIVALQENQNDFKVMNLLKKEPVGSPVHEYVLETGTGSGNIFFDEGEEMADDTSELIRIARTSKYMQTHRKVAMQLTNSKTIEDPMAGEKRRGIHHLLKGCESALFHGDSSINRKQFDSIPMQIVQESKKIGRSTVYDLRGRTMLQAGDEAISNVAQLVFESGGDLTHSFRQL